MLASVPGGRALVLGGNPDALCFFAIMRQQVLVLYLRSSALDSGVVAWAVYDGAGRDTHMAGDAEEPPYATGLAALRDGWRLIQASPLSDHAVGNEFRTGYLKYEFFFEKIVEIDGGDTG